MYKTGLSNKVAYALSRKTEGEIVLGGLATTSLVDWRGLNVKLEKDVVLKKIKQDIEEGKEKATCFAVVNRQLMYKGHMVISKTSSIIPKPLKEYHDFPVGGHSEDIKTYLRLAGNLFWMGMRKDVTNYNNRCIICQQHKSSTQHLTRLIQPSPIPSHVWDQITLDFIEELPPSKGYDTILVIVDRLTRYGHFIRLKHSFSAYTVANEFVKEIVHLHGFLVSIVSDRNRVFMSLFWYELFRSQGTTLKRSSAYHP